MAQEDSQSLTRQKVLDETQKDIQSIAAEVDFKPYLDAVSTGSQRTRFTIYVLVAALLIIVTTFRNTDYPDWIDSRLTQLQLASACLENNNSTPECMDAIKYAKKFIFEGGLSEGTSSLFYDKELKKELNEQINALIKQRTEALTMHLPFFGLAIDINDLGLVGGLFLAPILYVLYASLTSEIDNIERAKRKASKIKDKNIREDNLELLLMSQVLASPSKAKIGVSKGIYILFILVAAIHVGICLDDMGTLPIAVTLEGKSVAIIEAIIEWTACALVLFFCTLCFLQQKKLNESLQGLADPLQKNESNR